MRMAVNLSHVAILRKCNLDNKYFKTLTFKSDNSIPRGLVGSVSGSDVKLHLGTARVASGCYTQPSAEFDISGTDFSL